MKKHLLTFGIIFLYLSSFIPISQGYNVHISDNIEQCSIPLSKGNILYVGGNGPNNYTKIQDAINNANNGDTVYVYNATYWENIW